MRSPTGGSRRAGTLARLIRTRGRAWNSVWAVALVLLLGFAAFSRAETCGDADGNGRVEVTDGVRVLRAAAGLSGSCPPAVCDVDANGTVNVTDGVNVLRMAAELAVATGCASDPFVSGVTSDAGIFSLQVVKIPAGLVDPPGAAETISEVRVGGTIVFGQVNTVTVTYDMGAATAAADVEGMATLLIASTEVGVVPRAAFVVPLTATRGTVTLALDVKPDGVVPQLELRIATGIGSTVVGRVVVVVVPAAASSTPRCGDRVVDSGESCDPPDAGCPIGGVAGFCDDACTCRTSLPTPIVTGSPTPALTPTPTATVTPAPFECFTTNIGRSASADLACQVEDADSSCLIAQSSTAAFIDCSDALLGDVVCCRGPVPAFCTAAATGNQTGAVSCPATDPGTSCLVTQRNSDRSLRSCSFSHLFGGTALCCAPPTPTGCSAVSFGAGKTGALTCLLSNFGSKCVFAVRAPANTIIDCAVDPGNGGSALCCGGSGR